ncbi:MAG: ketopantoate reductase family protein [Clostridia bacterium]|nr:ketopantoate reductase family protein [Clostridia bacterium]
MKFAIYGAGSLGIVLSAYLARAGEKFDLIDRNPKSIDAIKKYGVKVTGKADLSQKVNAVLDEEVSEKYDIIFMLTKQINHKKTVEKVSKWLKKDGVVCTMQNGIPELSASEVVGENRTFGAAVGWGATRIKPGVSELTSENDYNCLSFSFGSLSGTKGAHYDEIIRILGKMGNVEIEENFIGARWVKLLINSAFSGVGTVCGSTFGEAAKNKESRKVIQRVIKECIDIANAGNIKIEKIQGKDVVKLLDYKSKFKKWLSFVIIPLAIKKHAKIKPSMLQDVEKGIPCEIDSINGVVLEYGKKFNVPCPFNSKVVEIIKKFETKELSPGFENIKLFKELF